MRLEGAMVAMATPFLEDGAIDGGALRKHIEFLIRSGVDGVFAASTVGEFVHLSSEQRHELVRLTAQICNGRIAVLAGATDLSADRVVEHCREFERAGATAAVIAPPYYYTLPQQDLIAHYRKVIERISLPFVLYHIPQFSNRMTVETMLRLVEMCRPIALKNSDTDTDEMKVLIDGLRGSKVTYLVGPDELLLTGLSLGAHGSLSGITGILPEAIRELIDAFRSGNEARAREIQGSVGELLELTSEIPFPAVLKWMLSIRGFEMGEPVLTLSEETRSRMDRLRPKAETMIRQILEG